MVGYVAPLIYLDTHAVVWLYAGQLERFSPPIREALDQSEILVSPMVLVELKYLQEVGRFSASVDEVVSALAHEVGLQVCDQTFEHVARHALGLGWTRDPFDRLIVSQAAMRDAPLITKDRKIRQHYARALWAAEDLET